MKLMAIGFIIWFYETQKSREEQAISTKQCNSVIKSLIIVDTR